MEHYPYPAILLEEIKSWDAYSYLKYLGYVNDMNELYKKVHIVVLPSYREGSPRSLMEASSMAIPIITTDVVGCRQVVDDGVTGLLCQARDSSDLALKMEEMFNMTENDREYMGKLGREKMLKEFDESIVINEYKNTINNIITKKFS